jgi:hypothetical protein
LLNTVNPIQPMQFNPAGRHNVMPPIYGWTLPPVGERKTGIAGSGSQVGHA